MAMDYKYFRINLYMKVNGKMIKQVEKDVLYLLMVIIMRESGKMISLTAKENM